MIFKKTYKLVIKLICFLSDAIYINTYLFRREKPCLVFGVNFWKRKLISLYFPDHRLIFLDSGYPYKKFVGLTSKFKDYIILIWGYKEPLWLNVHEHEIYRVEDGFLRSKDLGSNKALPLSLIVDRSGFLYFDSRNVSELEKTLMTYDFKNNHFLTSKAVEAKNLILRTGISKYNNSNYSDLPRSLIQDNRQLKVLIVGQCEDDASIKYGSGKLKLNNLCLAQTAKYYFPKAMRIFKEHPDIIAGNRFNSSSLSDISKYASVLEEDIPIGQLLDIADVVFVITSLVGLEALIREKIVYTLGQPFYSGWGLTKDLNPLPRRGRSLSVDEVFAASFLLYPTYRCPVTGKELSILSVINKLNSKES